MNSSDWIAETQSGAPPKATPDWITALESDSEFSDVSPFALARGAQAPLQTAPPLSPLPEPAPPKDYDRGFAAGEAAGRAAAQAEIAAEKDQKTALRLAFRELDQAAMDALAQELSNTVMALCDSVLAQNAADPKALEERARDAARKLGSAAGSCTLHLHPDDIADLEEGLFSGWQIEADPGLERGSVVLTGEEGGVRDGPAEWRRAIAAALRG